MEIWFKIVSIIALLMIGCTLVLADAEPGGLAAGLKRHYKFSTSTLGANGYPQVIPGTVLTVRKEGIVSFGENDASYVELCSSEFQGDEMRTPKGGMCTQLAPPGKRVLKVSETVCVTALKVDESADTVSMFLATCDRAAKGGRSGVYHAQVKFRFPRGSLRTSSAARVVDTISLALSEGQPAETAGHDTGQAAQGGDDTAKHDGMPEIPPPPSPADQAGQDKASPKSDGAGADSGSGDKGQPAAQGVTKGQSTDQVVAILGPPKSIADVGPKLIYFYSNLKVVFVNGKVSEIQSI